MKRATILSLLSLIVMASLVGCNALRGAGKDIENTGEHIENVGK